MTALTPERRAELRALCDAATPGPWWTDARYSGREMGCSIIAARTDCGPLPGNPTRGQVAFATALLNTEARNCEANARFIAAAREAAPALLDALDAAERERDAATARADRAEAVVKAARETAEQIVACPQGCLWNYGTRPTRLDTARWNGRIDAAREILDTLATLAEERPDAE